jgi:uncharacterized protein YqjF (DUF2071 family)
MELETEARDCLYVNWALPRAAAPALPATLRYETHPQGDAQTVFFSLLLFRLSDLHLTALPIGRLSFPQANLRFYVLDNDDMPAIYFLRTLVPWWLVPAARGLGGQPARPASLRFPRPSQDRDAECWRWRIWRGASLTMTATLSTPQIGPGPCLGSWDATLAHFRQRRRTYVRYGTGVRPVRAIRPMTNVWPLRMEVEHSALLRKALPAVDAETWLAPHSAWLSPQIPFRFELGPAVDRTLARARMPAAEGA